MNDFFEVRTSESLFYFFCRAGKALFFRGIALGDSVYFFCLDAKKVTKKDQGYAHMAKNGRVSPAQKKTRPRSV
ncbi:MAG: hypothetical protein ABW007_05515, partial [Chitinophagaceae bacterium]